MALEPSLQERKQELVRTEIFNAAWRLFGARGYEETTVAEIAAAAGVSRRTFFRYFASKEDVLVETTDEFAEAMLAAMEARPLDEPPLVAIERALVPVLESRIARTDRLQTIIRLLRESRTLFLILLPVGLGVFISTVYCRYHYVIDVIAGFLLALPMPWLGDWLYGRRGDEKVTR